MGEMAGSMLDAGGGRDELKTQFMTREGTYHLMTLAEYSRPNRVGYANQANNTSAPVKVSFVNSGSSDPDASGGEKIAFNYGRELFVYPYKGVRKAADLTKPMDKRVYKGTCPTCHDFGPPGCLKAENADVIPLLVGFSGGQVQLIDPARKELSRLYNEERLIDKTRVSCLKWAPGRGDTFLVSHASGQLYTYQADLECGTLPPQYVLHKGGEGFTGFTSKAKPANKNPVYRCSIGSGPINEFVFSPCGAYLATVSQDGMLRVFHFDTMELVGCARSYFGGLLCVCWSPDGKYIVTGGEDDLVTVYSFHEKRVVVRGQGHRSWVSVVSFDLYNLAYGDVPDGLDFSGSDDEGSSCNGAPNQGMASGNSINSPSTLHRVTGSLPCDSPGQPGPSGAAGPSGPTLHTHAGGISRGQRGHPTRTGPGLPEVSVPPQEPSKTSPTSPLMSVDDPQSPSVNPAKSNSSSAVTCYRFGSVGQDTLICLWDLTEDFLKKSTVKSRSTDQSGPTGKSGVVPGGQMSHSNSVTSKDSGLVVTDTSSSNHSSGASSHSSDTGKASSTSSLTHKLASLGLGGSKAGTQSDGKPEKAEKEHKRTFSLPGRGGGGSKERRDRGDSGQGSSKGAKGDQGSSHQADMNKDDGLGWAGCPRLCDTPMLEPVVTKKIAHERLTSLVFREECIVTACQDGYVCTWARPGRGQAGGGNTSSHCSASPTPINQGGTGTIV